MSSARCSAPTDAWPGVSSEAFWATLGTLLRDTLRSLSDYHDPTEKSRYKFICFSNLHNIYQATTLSVLGVVQGLSPAATGDPNQGARQAATQIVRKRCVAGSSNQPAPVLSPQETSLVWTIRDSAETREDQSGDTLLLPRLGFSPSLYCDAGENPKLDPHWHDHAKVALILAIHR